MQLRNQHTLLYTLYAKMELPVNQLETSSMGQFNPNQVNLISHTLCPFVQRSVILLTEQGTSFQRLDIDLANKPDWFKAVSPLGKVPVLVTNKPSSLFESQVICEYLDEIHPTSLHPKDPYEKARHRSWIEFGSGLLGAIASLYSAKEQDEFESFIDAISQKLAQLESQLDNGPYFSGQDFHIIDGVYGPIFRYFDTIEQIIDADFFDQVHKVNVWRSALANRPSIINAVSANYSENLKGFLKARNGYLASLMD